MQAQAQEQVSGGSYMILKRVMGNVMMVRNGKRIGIIQASELTHFISYFSQLYRTNVHYQKQWSAAACRVVK